jgi:hypothetical protein
VDSPPVDSPPDGPPDEVPPAEREWLPPRMEAPAPFSPEYEAFPERLGDRDAGGPRIEPRSLRLEGEAVVLSADRRLSKASVAPEAFSVSAYDLRDGWHIVEINAARLDRSQQHVRLELATGFGGNLVRVIARGTGPSPLLGTSLVPLAGEVGGPAGGTENGHDFVIMLKRSET